MMFANKFIRIHILAYFIVIYEDFQRYVHVKMVNRKWAHFCTVWYLSGIKF